ncbi:MAG: site-specific integrase [Clostridia bacterium]|nr:site-specific integrase [Clostridia bacterium]
MLINLELKGSVRERLDGLLELRVWLDGKRTSIYGRSEAELLQKFKILRRQRKKHTEKVVQPLATLYAWLDKWVSTYKADTVKPRTLSAIESCIKVHIKPNFADTHLNRLTPLQAEENLKQIKSSRMRQYTYQILNEAYKKALQLKLAKENPFAVVDVPQHKQKKGTPLTYEEQEQLKAALEGSPYKYYFLFLLYSGCRRCEGLSACWEDIDFSKKRIFIRGTKTELSQNHIPLFDNLADILQEIEPAERAGKIFPFQEHQVERAFNKLCPNHHIHDLRHTFATNCIEAGVELKAVQAWLRHANIGTTADTYAHATDKYLMQEAEKLNKK